MSDSDITISFGADVSGLQDGVAAAKDALDGVQPVLEQLAAPVQAFGAAATTAFGDTSASTAWAQSVAQSCSQAAAASTAAATAVQTHWKMSLDPIGSMFASNIDKLLAGTESFSQAFLRMGDQMLSRFLGWCLEMAERWAVKELTQTAASQAGSAVRLTTEAAAQTTGLAESAATAIADIGNSAARAAAGAFAAVAPTPIVGPALAPAAAASALAATLAFGDQVFSAEGGWGQVPYDNALTALHRNEMVLPSSIASPLRSMVGAGAAGSPGATAGGAGAVHHHWNIQALDAKSFTRMARANPDAITGALTSSLQRLGLTAGALAGRGGAR